MFFNKYKKRNLTKYFVHTGATAEVVQVKVAKTKGNKGGKGIKRKLTSGIVKLLYFSFFVWSSKMILDLFKLDIVNMYK